MGRLLGSLGGERTGRPAAARALGGLFGRWEEIVGPDLARHVQPVRLDGDRLVVEVAEPAWATQVRLLTDQITARVGEVVDVTLTTVEVRVASPSRRRAGDP
jgi:predicted nucleic acid-binding Zn ribbon protein